MVSGFISRIVILVFGTLYPAYASYKAVRTKNVKEYVKWMMYWIVFALFTCAETFTDLFLSFWFPFYYEIKIITVIYLLSPATKGSSILYRKFVHPVLIKREQEIDEYIAKAKEQGYHTMLNLGSKGVNYATSLIMQTAIKGGGGLVSQLKKSYSLNDLSGEQNLGKTDGESADDADSSYGQDPRLFRRNTVQGAHSPNSSRGQAGLYFPEAGINQLPGDEEFRQIPSYEEISSGYSSGEPYYYAMQQSKGCNLARTASLGPSSRIRTRASAKQGLPKRSSLSEGGSTWSAMEPYESQKETDNRFNFPLAHSASFPFAFPPAQYFFLPEYQHVFGNLTQNQIFAFINHSQNSQFLGNAEFELENSSDGGYESLKSEKSAGSSVVISEEAPENKNGFTQDNEFLEMNAKIGGNVEAAMQQENGKEEHNVKEEVKIEKDVKNDDSDIKEKSLPERSGRYNKKPAPIPPNEEPQYRETSLTEEEEADVGFYTPNASPKPDRKRKSLEGKCSVELDSERKPYDSNLLEVPKKSESKAKKTDSHKRKLHIPKMSFSFWHQKNSKQSSASETSSVASVEISTNSENKKDLEYFIPLRDDEGEGFGICNSPQTQERRKEETDDELDLLCH